MQPDFTPLTNYLAGVPSLKPGIGSGQNDDNNWWVKFQLDITHPLAWAVVQEIGHVCNYISLEERLPTWFYPVSPPPYMNGGPATYLSWVIETTDPEFTPLLLSQWLEGRLPRPVDDPAEWTMDSND